MAPDSAAKKILVPLEAGIGVMDRYDLFCESKYDWTSAAFQECAERVVTAHAPYQMEVDGESRRVNIASPNEDFRESSLAFVEEFIQGADAAPNCKTIVSHAAPHYWVEDAGEPCDVREVGQHDLFVEGLQRLSRATADKGLRLALENNREPWADLGPDDSFNYEVHHGKVREYFATSPREWVDLPDQVNEPAFGLCLDTSHATTYAQRFPAPARAGVLDLFLTLAPDRLWHIHWSDNFLESAEGRKDCHLTLGKGDLPKEFHRNILACPSVTTLLLEHWVDEDQLAFEMRFIERL